MDVFEFTGVEGEVFELDFSAVDGGRIGYTIFGPNGEEIFDQFDTSSLFFLDSGPITLPDTGTYRIEIPSEDDEVSYQFTALFGFVDLQVDSIEIPSSGFTGQEIDVSFVVTNHGTRSTNATGWIDRVLSLIHI